MYKNQLQELAQRSCFNLPSYTCIREGPDHAPRFRATVNFNGEIFESPAFCSTLRQAEHASAEVALNVLSRRGPSRSLAAKVLDESGVYKNLLQETAHRAGLELPVYTTIKSGPGHTPVFTSIVELAGLSFTGDPAKTKKQAQKNAAMAAWSALKQLPHLNPSSSPSLLEQQGHGEQGQVIIVHAPSNLWQPEVSRQSSRNNPMDGRCRLSRMQRAMHPASDVSSHSRPIQNRTYLNFSSKTDRYQMYQQTQASQQKSKMSIRPASNSVDPRVLPVIQSIYQPTQEHLFQTIDQDPSNGKENERLKLSFNAEVYSQSDISDTSPLLDAGRIVAIQELAEVQEKKCLPGQQEANITGTTSDSHSSAVHDPADAAAKNGRKLVQHFQTRSFEWTSGASVEPEPLKTNHHLSSKQKVNSFNINTNPEVHDLPPSSTLASSRGLGHHVMQTPLTATSVSSSNRSVSGFQPLRPWMMSIAAPVTIRTAIPVCSGRPASVNPDTRESWSSCITPAAHVRHVIPVRQPELNQMCKKEKGSMPEQT